MQASKEVKEAETAEQEQAQEIRALEKRESDVLDEHRLVSTQRAKLQKDLNQVTEEAQASRYALLSRNVDVFAADAEPAGMPSLQKMLCLVPAL